MSMIRNITVKLSSMPSVTKTDTEITDPEIFDSIIDLYIPLGFFDSKEMLMPVSRIILKWAVAEHFSMLANPGRDATLKNLILMITFWLKHPLMTDSFFCNNVIESIFLLLKSGKLYLYSQSALQSHSKTFPSLQCSLLLQRTIECLHR